MIGARLRAGAKADQAMTKRLARIGPHTRYRDLEGEAVLLHLGSGECFALDRIGNRAWQLIVELGDVDRVAAALASEFHAAPDVVASDLDRLVAELLARNLIEVIQLPVSES